MDEPQKDASLHTKGAWRGGGDISLLRGPGRFSSYKLRKLMIPLKDCMVQQNNT